MRALQAPAGAPARMRAAAGCSASRVHAPSAALRSAAPQRRARGRGLRATPAGAGGETLLELPSSTESQVKQAQTAVQKASDDGIKRQRLLLSLPLIGATDLDDWPGGTRQMWTAAKPMVSNLLQALQRQAGVSAEVARRVIDDADAVVELSVTPTATAVVFPTAETLGELRKVDGATAGTLLIVNPAWNTEGSNLISDLGFGPWKAANEAFIATFQETYHYREVRIRGQVLRVLRAYPRPWQVFALDGRGGTECIASQADKPTYADLERMLAALGSRSIANADWATRLQSEFKFNNDTLKPPPPQE